MDGERPLLLEEAAPRALRARRYAWLGEAAVSALRAAALIAVGVLLGARGLHRADSRDEPAAGARKVRSSSPQHELLGHDKDCASVNFTQETLMLISEGPIMRYFQMTARGELATGDVLKAYEASDVTRRDTRFAGMGERPVLGAEHETFVVFDNARSIGRFSSLLDSERDFPPVMLQYPDDDGSPSEFEGLAYDSKKDIFYAVQESAAHADGVMRAHVYEIALPTGGDGRRSVRVLAGPCDTEQTFSSANKGFEGADWLPLPGANKQGGYLLAICEGNRCLGGEDGRQVGGGRIVMMEKRHPPSDAPDSNSSRCQWVTAGVLHVPPTAAFMDYSAIALRPAFDGSTDWAVAISSQENAAVWLGRLTLNPQPGSHGAPHYDPARFALSKGRIYDFPRDNECRRIYCNIEGIAWQGEDKLVAASDQMKDGGRQDFRCWDKDQSLHTFLVPTDDMLGDTS
ncbi:hypothetical protein KFE25_014179 [Diacronema lutheri]|uniref:Uncharacterized protein n=1 Tax=Diacronema lutheri TaxID=2081491 RepID=A0A8J5X9T2_DIALT|nr:hypothetical protein KFE25_014179 [Diacronema lutheri]